MAATPKRSTGGQALAATVSGSFHRHMLAIQEAVHELVDAGVQVLSPADPRVVDQVGEFLFVASDRIRAVKLVEDRHLESVRASDFLWLVAPDGYVGQSASLELGYAIAAEIPIFSNNKPSDLTLREYVRRVDGIQRAIQEVKPSLAVEARSRGFLINPHASIEEAQSVLEEMQRDFRKRPHVVDDAITERVAEYRARIRALVGQ